MASELPRGMRAFPIIKIGILVAKEIVPKPSARMNKLHNKVLYSPNLIVTTEMSLTCTKIAIIPMSAKI